MSNDPSLPCGEPDAVATASPRQDETTRRYTRSAVARIRAAIAAARAQLAGVDAQTTQDCAPVAGPGDLPAPASAPPEVTQRYADDTRMRFQGEIAAARQSATPVRAAARFRLGDQEPRRSVPAPSIILSVEKAREFGVRPAESVTPVAPEVAPRLAAPRPCDLVGREPGALLFMMEDGALHVLDRAQVLAIAIAMVGTAPPTLVLDVVLDWGDAAHPADALRLLPNDHAFSRVYPGLSLADAVAATACDLAPAGVPTWPPRPSFPGPPWPHCADLRTFEAAWLALAPCQEPR